MAASNNKSNPSTRGANFDILDSIMQNCPSGVKKCEECHKIISSLDGHPCCVVHSQCFANYQWKPQSCTHCITLRSKIHDGDENAHQVLIARLNKMKAVRSFFRSSQQDSKHGDSTHQSLDFEKNDSFEQLATYSDARQLSRHSIDGDSFIQGTLQSEEKQDKTGSNVQRNQAANMSVTNSREVKAHDITCNKELPPVCAAEDTESNSERQQSSNVADAAFADSKGLPQVSISLPTKIVASSPEKSKQASKPLSKGDGNRLSDAGDHSKSVENPASRTMSKNTPIPKLTSPNLTCNEWDVSSVAHHKPHNHSNEYASASSGKAITTNIGDSGNVLRENSNSSNNIIKKVSDDTLNLVPQIKARCVRTANKPVSDRNCQKAAIIDLVAEIESLTDHRTISSELDKDATNTGRLSNSSESIITLEGTVGSDVLSKQRKSRGSKCMKCNFTKLAGDIHPYCMRHSSCSADGPWDPLNCQYCQLMKLMVIQGNENILAVYRRRIVCLKRNFRGQKDAWIQPNALEFVDILRAKPDPSSYRLQYHDQSLSVDAGYLASSLPFNRTPVPIATIGASAGDIIPSALNQQLNVTNAGDIHNNSPTHLASSEVSQAGSFASHSMNLNGNSPDKSVNTMAVLPRPMINFYDMNHCPEGLIKSSVDKITVTIGAPSSGNATKVPNYACLTKDSVKAGGAIKNKNKVSLNHVQPNLPSQASFSNCKDSVLCDPILDPCYDPLSAEALIAESRKEIKDVQPYTNLLSTEKETMDAEAAVRFDGLEEISPTSPKTSTQIVKGDLENESLRKPDDVEEDEEELEQDTLRFVPTSSSAAAEVNNFKDYISITFQRPTETCTTCYKLALLGDTHPNCPKHSKCYFKYTWDPRFCDHCKELRRRVLENDMTAKTVYKYRFKLMRDSCRGHVRKNCLHPHAESFSLKNLFSGRYRTSENKKCKQWKGSADTVEEFIAEGCDAKTGSAAAGLTHKISSAEANIVGENISLLPGSIVSTPKPASNRNYARKRTVGGMLMFSQSNKMTSQRMPSQFNRNCNNITSLESSNSAEKHPHVLTNDQNSFVEERCQTVAIAATVPERNNNYNNNNQDSTAQKSTECRSDGRIGLKTSTVILKRLLSCHINIQFCLKNGLELVPGYDVIQQLKEFESSPICEQQLSCERLSSAEHRSEDHTDMSLDEHSIGDGSYICASCTFTCVDKSIYANHMDQHATKESTSCLLCPYKGRYRKSLVYHLLKKHKMSWDCYVNSVTPQTVDESIELSSTGAASPDCSSKEESVISNQKETSESFQVCSAEFQGKSFSELNLQHFTNKRGRLYCPYCPYSTQFKHLFSYHYMNHTGERNYRCQLCSHCFVRKDSMKSHLRNMHQLSWEEYIANTQKQVPHVCDTDDSKKEEAVVVRAQAKSNAVATALSKNELKEVITATINSIEVPQENESVTTTQGLKESEQNMVMATTQDKNDVNKAMPVNSVLPFEHLDIEACKNKNGIFQCPHCTMETSTFSSFCRHYLHHSGEQPYQCLLCSFNSDQKILLLSHIETDHKVSWRMYNTLHVQKQQNNNKVLLFNAVKQMKLKRVLRIEDAPPLSSLNLSECLVKPDVFQCPLCVCTFTNKHSLSRHYLLHSGEMLLSCRHCLYVCTTQSSLDKHICTGDQHTMEKHAVSLSIEEAPDGVAGAKLNPELVSPNYFGGKQAKPTMPTISADALKKIKLDNLVQYGKTVHDFALGDGTFRCSFCGEIHTRKDSFRVHFWKHTGFMPFKCPKCSMKSRYIKCIKSHLLTGHGTKISKTVVNSLKASFIFEATIAAVQTKMEVTSPAHVLKSGTMKRERDDDKDDDGEVVMHKRQRIVTGQTAVPLCKYVKSDYHVGDHKYVCPVCSFRCKKLVVLQEHYERMHLCSVAKDGTNPQRYKCRVCLKRFLCKAGLISHLRTHRAPLSRQKKSNEDASIDGKSPLKLKLSSLFEGCRTKSNINASSTLPSFEQSRPAQANTDSEKVVKENEAMLMRYTGSGIVASLSAVDCMISENTFLCPDCGALESSHNALLRHYEMHFAHDSAIASNICSVKQSGSKQPANTPTNAVTASEAYYCEFCSLSTDSEAKLQEHINAYHLKPNRYMKCKYCPYRTATERVLKIHTTLAHKRKTETLCTAFDFEKCKISVICYVCNICQRKYPSEESLVTHYTNHSTGVLECCYCAYKTPDESDLAAHLDICQDLDQGETSVHDKYYWVEQVRACMFSCPHCSKLWPTKTKVARHYQTHLKKGSDNFP